MCFSSSPWDFHNAVEFETYLEPLSWVLVTISFTVTVAERRNWDWDDLILSFSTIVIVCISLYSGTKLLSKRYCMNVLCLKDCRSFRDWIYATMSSFVRMRKNWCYPLIRFLSKSILCAENQSHFFWIARILARNCLNSGSYLIPQCISWGILSIGRSSRFLREGCGGNTFPFIRFPPSVLIIYSYWMEENAETKEKRIRN